MPSLSWDMSLAILIFNFCCGNSKLCFEKNLFILVFTFSVSTCNFIHVETSPFVSSEFEVTCIRMYFTLVRKTAEMNKCRVPY